MELQELIQSSLDYIEDNLQTEITAAELAKMAHVSEFHYYRLFQKATGVPVMQYILRRRLLHGIYAMQQGSSKIDVALAYGFDTYAGFYRAFSREFGTTPSEFLKSCRVKRPYRINLKKEKHRMITHKKASQILKNWNLEGETITDIYYEGSGCKNESACYVGDRYVLKYTSELEKMTHHMAVSKALARAGLLAAEPVETVAGQLFAQEDEVYYYVTKRLPGSQLPKNWFTGEDAASHGRFLGEILGKLHLALGQLDVAVSDTDLLSKICDWALPNARDALGLTDQFCKDYVDTFRNLYPELPRQIIHRDPNPGNIICAGDAWGFIDFDLTERNVRIYDLCYAATAILSENFETGKENWLGIYREIVGGYDGVAHLSAEEKRAIPYVLLANQLVCVAWFAGQEKYAEIFQINKEMTLWLLARFEELKKI